MPARRSVMAERIRVEAMMNGASTDDALSRLAPLLRVRPELQDFCRFGGSWMSPHEKTRARWAQFHLVLDGSCVVERKNRPPVVLETGDALLLPHGEAHVLRSATSAGPSPRMQNHRGPSGIRMRTSADVPLETELICGRLHFGAASGNLVSALPDTIHARAGVQQNLGQFNMLMASIRDELESPRMGSLAIACDLASAFFVVLIRNHLELHVPGAGLLRLLADRTTGRAVKSMIEDPARDWTLDDLAKSAATSRSTLARLFRKIGETAPLAFLTELRLDLAKERIMTGGESLAQIAIAVGYQSEGALSRAMQRQHGIRPGSLKR